MINALREYHGDSIVVAAPTGVAANNISAQTIHSLLKFTGNVVPEMTNTKTIARTFLFQ